MLYLKSLKFGNFGRFIEEQEYDFTQYEKLLLIDGISGAGKSTLFQALLYLLGINTKPSTKLQCRYTKKSMYVVGEFVKDGNLITISRSKNKGLKIQTVEKKHEGDIVQIEEELDKIIGIPRKLFQRMVYKPQKQGGFFLKLTASKMYDFLMELLGLKPYQIKMDLISDQIKTFNKQIDHLKISELTLTEQFEELKILQESNKPPIKQFNEEQFQNLKMEVSILANQIDNLEKDRKSELSQLIMPEKPQNIKYDDSELTKLSLLLSDTHQGKNILINDFLNKKDNYNKILIQFNQNLNNIQSLKIQLQQYDHVIIELTKQQEELSKNSCPTCKQVWVGDSLQQKLFEIAQQIEHNKLEYIKILPQIENESELITKRDKLNTIVSNMITPDTTQLDQQIQQIQELIIIEETKKNNYLQSIEGEYLTKHNRYLQQIRAIESKYDTQLSNLKEQRTYKINQVIQMEEYLKHFEEQVIQYNENSDKISKLCLEKQDALFNNSQQIKDLDVKITIAEESKRLIKSYTLQIFQETLDNIGEVASQILSNIHNMNDASIYFEGCKENKNGTIRDEINAIVNKQGDNNIPIETLSGGEETVIELAVDLALIDTIENKVGKGANFFIIDEPFDGLDSEGKEQYLEILKQVDTNKQIILVDHGSELKEMINDVITIEK